MLLVGVPGWIRGEQNCTESARLLVPEQPNPLVRRQSWRSLVQHWSVRKCRRCVVFGCRDRRTVAVPRHLPFV